jgi:pimeloyl-ACP methyl ester carboxylesterase
MPPSAERRTFAGTEIKGICKLSASVSGVAPATPLIIALHGGGHNANYFDVPSYSLLDAANAQGISAIALDRPGYGKSPSKLGNRPTLSDQAIMINEAISAIWLEMGKGHTGVVLVGHSIGAAITMMIAADQRNWPLLGIALSGIGHIKSEMQKVMQEQMAAAPDQDVRNIPVQARTALAFGQDGLFDNEMPELTSCSHAPSITSEARDVIENWLSILPEVALKITVPVHFRLGTQDGLWVMNDTTLSDFTAMLSSAPLIDAAILPGIGHCIDFHNSGPQFHRDQIEFAIGCNANFIQLYL